MPNEVAVLTHAARDDDALAARLRAGGVRVIEMPCVTIVHLAHPAPIAAAIAAVGANDWLVVTSPAGADAVGRVARPRARVAAIGPSTAARLSMYGIPAAFVPSAAKGEALGWELPRAGEALLARSDRALPDLPRILRRRGFVVSEVIAYETRIGVSGDVASVREALASDDARVAIYVESPSALEGLRAAIEPELLARGVITSVAHS